VICFYKFLSLFGELLVSSCELHLQGQASQYLAYQHFKFSMSGLSELVSNM